MPPPGIIGLNLYFLSISVVLFPYFQITLFYLALCITATPSLSPSPFSHSSRFPYIGPRLKGVVYGQVIAQHDEAHELIFLHNNARKVWEEEEAVGCD